MLTNEHVINTLQPLAVFYLKKYPNLLEDCEIILNNLGGKANLGSIINELSKKDREYLLAFPVPGSLGIVLMTDEEGRFANIAPGVYRILRGWK